MTSVASKASLSPARQRLVAWMQRLGFGLIEGLTIQNGEPVFDPPPRVIRDVKFCAENGPRPEAGIDDFVLKAQVRDLFVHFDRLANGTIRRLDVQHGLPFRMQIEEVTA